MSTLSSLVHERVAYLVAILNVHVHSPLDDSPLTIPGKLGGAVGSCIEVFQSIVSFSA